MADCIIWKENLVAFKTGQFNFDEFLSAGPDEKHTIAIWNLGTHLSMCFKAQGNLEVYK
jgi:hypothetical protein